MATDLGELLVPYMPTIRVPRTGDRVYKSECAFSYDSPVSSLVLCGGVLSGVALKTGRSQHRDCLAHVKCCATSGEDIVAALVTVYVNSSDVCGNNSTNPLLDKGLAVVFVSSLVAAGHNLVKSHNWCVQLMALL